MNVMRTIANVIESAMPLEIHSGPPLPKVFNIKWPYGVQGKIPEPIYNLGTKINSVTYGLIRKIG